MCSKLSWKSYGWQLKFSNIDLIQYSDGRPLSSDLGIVTDMAD